MKKITILAMLLMAGLTSAQTTFEASPDYAKLQEVTYDRFVQNKLYAATNGNHIVVSTDNGAHWDLLYSHPTTDFLADLKLAPGNTALTFATYDQIHIFNLASNAVTTYDIPQSGVAGSGPSYVNSYDLYDADGTTMVVDTGFSVGLAHFTKVFYTNDAGLHWSEIYYTVDHDNVFINDVAISPNNPDKIFLARGNGDSDVIGGLWISMNQGQDWTQDIAGVTLDAISFNPGNANDVMIGSSIGFGSHPEKLYRSFDNGVNWSEIPIAWNDGTLNNITRIVFNPANTDQIMVLEENEIVRTNDGGTTWISIVYPLGIAMDYYYGLNASYNPFNNQVAITTDFYSQFFDNTTATLTQIKAPFFYAIGASVGKYSGGVHLYYGSRGHGARHHKNMYTGVTSTYDVESPNSFNPKVHYMFADPSIAGRVFTYAPLGSFGGWLNMSTDYGATTTNILQAFADDMQELTIDPNNTNLIYVSMRSGESGSMVKIDVTDIDNIVTTDIVTPDVTEFGDGVITGIVIDPTDSNIIYISKRHKILKTVDGGLNWSAIGTGLEAVTSADIIWDMQGNPLNANQLTIGTNIGVYTSMDSGATWTSILPGTDAKRIKHSPLHDGVVVVSIFSAEFVLASIAYSADNGDNWNYVTPEDIHYAHSYGMEYDFEGNDINAYIATTDLGVLRYEIKDLPLGTSHPVANAIGIYPNPASGNLTVFARNSKIKSVRIFTLTGQLVSEAHSAVVDVSGLSHGIYLVKAILANGDSVTERLVKE